MPEGLRAVLFGAFRGLASRFGGRRLGLARIPGLMKAYGFLYSTLRPTGTVLAEVQGQRMYVNPEDSHIAASLITLGKWEKRETEVLAAAIEPGMTVLDLGANIGYYTLLAARLVGPHGRVHAFEPDPKNYDLLVKNVRLNGYTNVTTVRAAVADRTERARLYVDAGHWGESLSERNIAAPTGSVEVEMITLDSLIDRGELSARIDVMKIDVQGAEGMVRSGAARLLRRDRPKILMELEPARLRNLGTDPLELLRAFAADGYAIHPIDGQDGLDGSASLESIVADAEAAGVINVFMVAG